MNFFTMSEQEVDYQIRRRAGQVAELRELEAHQRDAAAANRRAALVMVLSQAIAGGLQASTFNFVRLDLLRTASLAADDILAQQP